MTDEELKQLVASLAIGQQKLQLAQQKTDEQLQKTDEQLRLTDQQLRLTDQQLKVTHEELRNNIVELQLAQKKTDEQLRLTDEKLKKVGELLGNIGRNQGDIAEEFFFNSLAKHPHLGSLIFEDIAKNNHKQRGKIQEEYDLILTNRDSIGIVEVKYKAHLQDLTKLMRKLKHFKLLFPIYQHYKIYGAIAAFYLNDETKYQALKQGLFVLQRYGNLIHTEAEILIAI